jgi:hypothetical protein
MPASVTPSITGLLLAGGRATRMDGADKGLQLLDGTPLALHVLRRLAGQVDEMVISANRNADRYAELGAPFRRASCRTKRRTSRARSPGCSPACARRARSWSVRRAIRPTCRPTSSRDCTRPSTRIGPTSRWP